MFEPALLERHFEEASFLWQQREHVRTSHQRTAGDLDALERRLRGHLDGLVLAGATAAEKKLAPVLEDGEPEHIAVATLVLLAEDIEREQCVLDILRQGSRAQRLAVCQALQTRPRRGLEASLLRMLEAGPAELQALLLDVLASWRALPTAVTEQFLAQGEARTRAAALRASGSLDTRPSPSLIRDSLAAEESEVRQAAMVTGLLQGVDAAWATCLREAASPSPEGAVARLLVAIGGEPREQALLLEALAAPGPARRHQQLLWALGFSGRADAAGACVAMMSSPEPLPRPARGRGLPRHHGPAHGRSVCHQPRG